MYKCEVLVIGKKQKGWKFKLQNPQGEEIFELNNEKHLYSDYESSSDVESSPMIIRKQSVRSKIAVKDTKRHYNSEIALSPLKYVNTFLDILALFNVIYLEIQNYVISMTDE